MANSTIFPQALARSLDNIPQKDLAIRLKTSQPRVAKIERAASDVSFDQIFRAYAVLGGRIVIKDGAVPNLKKVAAKKKVKLAP